MYRVDNKALFEVPLPDVSQAQQTKVCAFRGRVYVMVIFLVVILFGGGGEVVTSRYFHRKAVLSTLDQLGKPKAHT
jgi:hypothetical protein